MSLFEALSQVIYPILSDKTRLASRIGIIWYCSAYLLNNSKPLANLVQCLAQSDTIVCCVHLCESKKGFMFDPVASDSEIGICVGGLPWVTCQTHVATDDFALSHCVLDLVNYIMFKTYIEALLESLHLLLEHLHYCLAGLLLWFQVDATGCMSCNWDHLFEWRVFKSSKWLICDVLSQKPKSMWSNIPD